MTVGNKLWLSLGISGVRISSKVWSKEIFSWKITTRCLIGVLVVLLREEGEELVVVAIAEPPKNEHELITSINKLVEIIHMLLSYYICIFFTFPK
jgi:hypothetical protein